MEKELVPCLIYSNVTEMAMQQRYVFQTMWTKARPAAERIAGVQDGRGPEYLGSLRDSAEARDIFRV